MICPHCNVAIHEGYKECRLIDDPETQAGWTMKVQLCPECRNVIVLMNLGRATYDEYGNFAGLNDLAEVHSIRIWPRYTIKSCPKEVPNELREDFLEACAVMDTSPKASAALSRRCMQQLLREYAKTNSKELSGQIREVIDNHVLSSDLEEQLDAVRNIGNFAAHPQKDKSTGEILPVEPSEAEWNLEVLQDLFDHFFVKPALLRKRKEELNKKLLAAGKPPLPL